MRRSILALVLAVVVGCKKKPPPPVPNVDQIDVDGGGIAQARFGGDPDDQPRVPFVIDAVHEKQKPKTAAPWHEPGGEWTFFDAHLGDGTKLGFGILDEPKAGGSSFSFGKGMLTVPDVENGAKLAKRLSLAFHGTLPPASARGPLRIEPFSLAILGKDSGRGDNGFSGRGSWTATKLFLQRPGIEAEVFFNFDLVGKKGELAEKDQDYANDLVAFVARELRDGPPPPRTPESDPTVSAVGPKLDEWRVVQSGKAQFVEFEGNRFVFTVPDGSATRVMSAAIADPTNAIEVTRTTDRFGGLKCAGDTCILTESKPSQGANTWSSSDPTTYSLVDRKSKTKRVLPPPVPEAAMAIYAPLSPDGAWIAWRSLKKVPKEKQKNGRIGHWILHVAPASGGAAKVVEEEGHSLDVVGWAGAGTTLKAVVQDGASYEKEPPTWSLLDPKSGARTPIASAPASVRKDEALSPDGKHRVVCKDGAIVVTPTAGGGEKRVAIHPDDRKALAEEHCVSWATSKYLHYAVDRLAFIDIDTMKLSFVFPVGEEPRAAPSFTDDFAWAVQTTPEGIRLAKVVVR
jgi:hypothetical protein